MVKKRRPLVAAIFSFIAPGLGHFYAGRWRSGLVVLGAGLVIGNLSYALLIFWDHGPWNVLGLVVACAVFFILQIWHAVRVARSQPVPFEYCWYNRWYYYLAYLVILVSCSGLVLPVFGDYHGLKMPSTSMEDSFFAGERILADYGAYDSKPVTLGDLVVFVYPGDGVTRYVKRCVAVEGDTVEIIHKQLFVNGIRAVEPATVKFLDTTESGTQNVLPRREDGGNSRDNFGPYVVPPSAFFVLGDNRDNSFDSRYWQAVPVDNLVGKVIRIYYSPDWSRIGKTVK